MFRKQCDPSEKFSSIRKWRELVKISNRLLRMQTWKLGEGQERNIDWLAPVWDYWRVLLKKRKVLKTILRKRSSLKNGPRSQRKVLYARYLPFAPPCLLPTFPTLASGPATQRPWQGIKREEDRDRPLSLVPNVQSQLRVTDWPCLYQRPQLFYCSLSVFQELLLPHVPSHLQMVMAPCCF